MAGDGDTVGLEAIQAGEVLCYQNRDSCQYTYQLLTYSENDDDDHDKR